MDLKAVPIGSAWIVTSAIFSTYANSLFLNTFHDEFAHMFVRFSISSALSLVAALKTKDMLPHVRPGVVRGLFVPSSLMLTANLFNSMSMVRSGVIVTYVVKSLIPFFTVMLCRAQGQNFSSATYAALFPTCVGVALASAADMEFEWQGFLCAFASAWAQTLLNVCSKSRIQELKISGREAFFVMATWCTVLSSPLLFISYYVCPHGLMQVAGGFVRLDASTLAAAVLAVGLAYHIEYMLNFLLVPLCSSLAFSVADVSRRSGTILFGAVLFGKQLGLLSLMGVAISMAGATAYAMVTSGPRAGGKAASVSPRGARDGSAWPEARRSLGDWASEYSSKARERGASTPSASVEDDGCESCGSTVSTTASPTRTPGVVERRHVPRGKSRSPAAHCSRCGR